MFYVEHAANGDVFSSLSETLYWGIATMTSVGSSLVPITPAGKVVLSVLSILGVLVVAIPAGIVSAGFVQTMMDDDALETMKAQNEALQASAIIAAERRLTRASGAAGAVGAAMDGGLTGNDGAPPPPKGGAGTGSGAAAAQVSVSPPPPRDGLAASPPPPHGVAPLYIREASTSSLAAAVDNTDAGSTASGGGGRSSRRLRRENSGVTAAAAAAAAAGRPRAKSLHLDSVGSVRMLALGGGDGSEPVLVPSLTMQCPHCNSHIHVSVGLA